ncbi:MFS general substrate transporter [Trichophyton interdigitale]|nr:MFS general substrate transporter [Trichophyton interdigitale]KAG5219018.1 MFS general substrate transporter [Trichophyton interdigitale]KAG8207740.1 MFS general substrate transporter [Trichophyton interdigitale]
MSAPKLETSGAGVEISAPAGPGESDPEPISEKTEIEKGEENTANDVEASPKKSLAFKLAFVGLASSLFVFQLDATALSIALPTIAADLGGQSLESFWANLSYTLCGIALQPIWASISNAFGRKPPLYVCMTLFFVGSVVFAVAKNMNTIIIGRVLQGFGGGGIDVLVEVVIADMTTLQERSKYIGLMGIVLAIGNIMGPSVGALFATYASWRWIGWVNLPLLGIGMPLIYFFLRLRPVPLDKSLAKNLVRLDWFGMMLVIVGITILVLPISWAGSLFPWSSWQTLVPMLLGVLVLALFGLYEAKPAAPIVPHRLFHSKTANMTLAGGFIHSATLVSLLQYLPLIYQAVQLETPILSAVSLLPTVVTSVLLAATSMMMVPFFGGYVWLLRLSWIILALGTGLLALLHVESTSSMRLGVPILWGAGVALLRLNLLPMQASVKKVDDTGLAIGLFLTIRMFGGLIGLTMASTIFNTVFSTTISSSAAQLTGPLLPLRDASNAVAFIEKLRSLDVSPETLLPVLKVYLKCFQTIFYTMTGLSGLGFVTSIFIDEIALSGENLGNQRFEE